MFCTQAPRVPHKLTGEENKHLIRGVVVVGYEHRQVRPPGTTLTRFVTELTLKLIQRLVQLILGHQITSVMAKLQGGKPAGELVV